MQCSTMELSVCERKRRRTTATVQSKGGKRRKGRRWQWCSPWRRSATGRKQDDGGVRLPRLAKEEEEGAEAGAWRPAAEEGAWMPAAVGVGAWMPAAAGAWRPAAEEGSLTASRRRFLRARVP